MALQAATDAVVADFHLSDENLRKIVAEFIFEMSAYQ